MTTFLIIISLFGPGVAATKVTVIGPIASDKCADQAKFYQQTDPRAAQCIKADDPSKILAALSATGCQLLHADHWANLPDQYDYSCTP